MKKFCIFLVCIMAGHFALAQKYMPKISVGSVISYDAFATASGQQVQLTLTVLALSAPMSIKWEVPGYGTGTFEISQAALDSAKKMRISQPQPDQVTRFKDDQTIMLVSKATYAELVKTQGFTLNGVKFSVVASTDPYMINGKEADVFYAKSSNGKVELWILNNPDFPLICALKGNPQGIDLTLTSVKE